MPALDAQTVRPHDRDHVGSLAKGLGVLEIIAGRPQGLSLSEVGEAAGLTRAGARRLLLTLVAEGYAVQDGRRFRLSPRLLGLARTWLQGTSLWTYAEPQMRGVAERLGESCSAAVLSGQDILYVARVAGPRILSVALHVGARLPAWCTAMGRILLAGLPEDQLDRHLAEAKIEARTPRTLTDRDAVRGAIAAARAQGYAVLDQELELGLLSLAVPIRDRSGAVVAAVNVSSQAGRVDVAEMERRMLPPLREAQQTIEAFLAIQ